jgi:uncharacterized protein
VLSVARLFIHPVKSLGGIELSELAISARGPKWDREWMVVGEDGTFLTQRQRPKMALIKTELEYDGLTLAFGGASLRVPLERSRALRRVTVWKDSFEAEDQGDEAARWLTEAIGVSCRLVRYPENHRRAITERFAQAGDWTAFADGYPLLAILEESLDDLSRRCGRTLEAERFRPNLVLRGAPAWSEDGWKTLKAAGLSLRAAKPCARCAITTVDPKTAETGPEPLKTLAEFRRGPDGGVLFGVNVIPDGPGRLRVGWEIAAE